jgi:hypothetical protein
VGKSVLRASLTWAIALMPVLVLAGLHVPLPFGGDQAMFVYGARELAGFARLPALCLDSSRSEYI